MTTAHFGKKKKSCLYSKSEYSHAESSVNLTDYNTHLKNIDSAFEYIYMNIHKRYSSLIQNLVVSA